MGAIFADASDEQLDALSRYGAHIGLAFQIVDDILDVVQSSEALGKTAGKDAAQHKITFPAVYGLDESRRMAEQERRRAHAALRGIRRVGPATARAGRPDRRAHGMKAGRRRIDQLLVERSLAESREKAQALLLAGQVLVNGQKVDKAGAAVDTAAAIEILARMPWVGRGGYKLAAALDHWGIDVTGRACVDIGSSTGGFTDCLLQRGARARPLRRRRRRPVALEAAHGSAGRAPRRRERAIPRAGGAGRARGPCRLRRQLHLGHAHSPRASPAAAAGRRIRCPREAAVRGRPRLRSDGAASCASRRCTRRFAVRWKTRPGCSGSGPSLMESPLLGAEGNKEFLLYATDRHCRDHRQA